MWYNVLMNEFLRQLSQEISEILTILEGAENAPDPDIAEHMNEDAQDRLQEMVIRINGKVGD
ncbi:MAG: hypothetical protein ACHQX3_00560 [Nitrospirales bacterium]